MTPTQSNPWAALGAQAGNPSTSMPGLNLPGISMPGVDPKSLSANPQSVIDLLSRSPQSLTQTMAPLYQQLLSTQGGELQSQYGAMGEQGAANAVSGAAARGLTGSSIEGSDIAQAYGQAGMGYQQAYAALLGNITGQYGQAAQFDIGQQGNYYQNLAQALGQEYSSNVQQSQFQQQLQAGMQEAANSNRAQMWSAGIGAIGGLGAGALMHFSDLRLKEGERFLGYWRGLRLWSFRYKRGTGLDLPGGTHVGLMAHEVPAFYEGATRVVKGYLAIDYDRLLHCLGVDLTFRRAVREAAARA